MSQYRTIDLFAGLGGIRLGFEAQGCESVFGCDWDLDSQKIYQANFGDTLHGDITKILPTDIPEHDILLAGFPCQPFSIIGKSLGFADTRGTLFFNIEEILRVKKPYAFMLENVKQLLTHQGGRTIQIILQTLETLGYSLYVKVLNALDYGLPQKRERIFIVGFLEDIDFSFPLPANYQIPLSEILEPESELCASLYASPKIVAQRAAKVADKNRSLAPAIWHENKSGNISILPYSCALRAGASYNYLLVNGMRRLSAREMLRLQGFPDSYLTLPSYQAMRKLTGNSVAVPVIAAVAKNMIEAMNKRQKNYLHRPKQLNFLDLEVA
jgi:DNA (cytosine-5)-methyltransferase 1